MKRLKINRQYLYFIFIFLAKPVFAGNDIDPISMAANVGSFINNTTTFIKSVIDRIRDSKEKEQFRNALIGGHSIYLDEASNNRMEVRPTCVPYHIMVDKAIFRAMSGKTEEVNATRSAKMLFDGKLSSSELVRKRKFARNEFGIVEDFAKGEKKVLDIFFKCLDHNGKIVADDRKASAHEMQNILVSCADVPSFFGGKFPG